MRALPSGDGACGFVLEPQLAIVQARARPLGQLESHLLLDEFVRATAGLIGRLREIGAGIDFEVEYDGEPLPAR